MVIRAPMPLFRIFGLAPAAAALLLCCCAFAARAENPANPGQDAGARLVFTHAEPVKQTLLVRDERADLTNLKLWFKNEGKSPARLVSLGAMQVMTNKALTPPEEENYFLTAREEWSAKLDGAVQPGQTVSFTSRGGIDDQDWSDFLAKRKRLYSFLDVSYRSEGSDSKDETETESCVWFQNGDVNAINSCKTDRNRVLTNGK